jgi:hypothetical protein
MNFDVQDNWADVPNYKKQGINWVKIAPNSENILYQARVDSNKWMIRLNDFPDEPLYTLIVGGAEIIHFNEWPAGWNK